MANWSTIGVCLVGAYLAGRYYFRASLFISYGLLSVLILVPFNVDSPGPAGAPFGMQHWLTGAAAMAGLSCFLGYGANKTHEW